MRILNIRFKNINSLEGEGRVDFDRGPIAESGVFAITGPNGSGKSSLLDVITLGLYGETYRFNKPAEHVMTQQTQDCYAQVEFQRGDDQFLAVWHMQRDAASPEMQLWQLREPDPQLLADTPIQVRQQVAELTGMDFHRFSKSMVLPQGDFAAFLHALDSERMDILEKISGTELYQQALLKTESDYQQAQTRLLQVQKDMDALPIMDDASLEAAQADLHDFQAQVEELQARQQLLQQQLDQQQQFAALQAQQIQKVRQRQDLQAQIEQHEADLQRIDSSAGARTFTAALQELDQKQAAEQQAGAALEQMRTELAQLQQQLRQQFGEQILPDDLEQLTEQKKIQDQAKLRLSEIKLELPRLIEQSQALQLQLTDRRATLAEVSSWLQQHSADSNLLSEFPDVAQLRNLRTELANQSSQHKTEAGRTKKTADVLKKQQTALSDAKTEVDDLTRQIADDQAQLLVIEQGKDFEAWKEQLQDQQQRVKNFEELNSIARVLAQVSEKKGWFSWLKPKKPLPVMPDVSGMRLQLDELQQEMSREDNIGKVLEQAVRNQALIKKLASERDKLVDGQPCFLCGSLQHPYVTKPPVLTDARKALVDQRTKVQRLKSQIQALTKTLNAAENQATRMTSRQQRLQQLRAEWELLANRLSVVRDGMAVDNLTMQKRLLLEEQEELTRLKALVEDHARIQRRIAQNKLELEKQQARVEKLTASVAQLQDSWDNRPPEFDEQERRMAETQRQLEALEALLQRQLPQWGEKLPGKGKENAVLDRLSSRRQDYQIYALREKGLQEELADLQQNVQQTQNTIQQLQVEQERLLQELDAEQWLNLQWMVLDKQNLIVTATEQYQQVNALFTASQSALLAQLAGTPWPDVASLRAILNLLGQLDPITLQYREALAQRQTVDFDLQQLAAQLDMLDNQDKELLDQQELQRALQVVHQQSDIAEQERSTVQHKLDKQQHYQQQFQQYLHQRQELMQVFQKAEADYQLLHNDEVGFKRQVRAQAVDQLLAKANQILEQLGGRYFVRSASSDHGLALQIEDNKQQGLRRTPQSLSGGESFVVSLSLALALADIANNGQSIDSLFLDEGFGSLDSEALYQAMTILEGLKTQGKTVGVISHVEAVKKRIKTQIELVKKPNGLSELKLVA